MKKVYNKQNLCVLEAVAKDDIRESVNSIYFKKDGKVVGTDSLMLIETSSPDLLEQGDEDMVSDIDEDFLINRKDVEGLKLLKSQFPMFNERFFIDNVENDSGKFKLETFPDDTASTNIRIGKKVTEKFPEYDKVLNYNESEVSVRVKVDAKLLVKMARAVLRFKEKGMSDVYISIRNDSTAVIFETKNTSGQEFKGALMPMTNDKSVKKDV